MLFLSDFIGIGLFVLAIICIGLLLVLRFYDKRYIAELRQKQEDVQKELQDDRLRELDAVKTKLYTNITHEFRTPLTVILGMAEQIKSGISKEKTEYAAELIERNGRNLLDLINQMLDLSKLESNRMALHPVQDDITAFIPYLLQSFESIAESKKIGIHFYSESEKIIMDFDPERISRVMANLVSNALKFTPKGGNVYVNISRSEGKMTLKVRDTGIGIQPDKLPFIFDRFYQVEKGMAGQFHQVADSQVRESVGTGIGLALVRELVKLMRGEINVKSKVGKWTEFIIDLPIFNNAKVIKATDINEASLTQFEMIEAARNEVETTAFAEKQDDEGPVVLVVEDNADVAQYIQICLEKEYQTLYAPNGGIGIEVALEKTPDLIISDVMMPVKDGLELTDSLKNDERTSHVPIILLTAKAGILSKLEGLKRGADVYLSKPFNQKELLGYVEQLIENRKRLQERYKDFTIFAEKDTTEALTENPVKIEDEFIIKVNEIIEASINKADFGVLQLVHKLRMSRSQVFRKLKALTGKSIALYIRSYRLQKAKKMLQNSDLNVSEIAYDVGFNNLSYFSRSFLEEFGVQPNATRK